VDKTHYESPVGWLEIKGDARGVTYLNFLDTKPDDTGTVPSSLKRCCQQVDEYFKGERMEFDLKLILHGTEFQKTVWNELAMIPFGKTVTYQDVARAIHNKKAMRAVGNANRKNPIAIIIPCHRVIGSDGNLVGFGGGLWRKKWLLDHERDIVKKRPV